MDSSGSQEKKPIPRFASFKPPPAPLQQPDRPSERRSRESTRRHEESRHRSEHRSHHHRSRSRDRRRDHKERHHRHRHKEDRNEAAAPPVTVPDTAKEQTDATDLYIVDRKGDRHNLIYGTIHRYSVPGYYRVGRGSILGLPPRYKIDRDTVEGDALSIRTGAWQGDATRSKSKSIFAKLNKQKPRLVRMRHDAISNDISDVNKDFLPLRASKSRNRSGVEDVDLDDERLAYRSILGKAKPEDNLPSDVEAASESSEDEGHRVDLSDEIKQLNVDLSRNVEQHPYDVDAWLRLIDHQEAVLRGAEHETRPLTYAEKMSLADIKLSLCEKALKKTENNPAKDQVLLKLLEEGAQLWDTKRLSEQWQSILKSNSQFISLWVKYLDFRQTEFLDFTYERCMATFIDCLRLNLSSPSGPEKIHVQNYLFLRLTLFMREAGFAEHAVGLWQAVLESTIFRPDELSLSREVLPAFTEFWESEVARIGDVGSKGWRSRSSLPVEPKAFTPRSQLNPKSIFATWPVCERERILNARIPARSLDESDDDDPYRVIISSDFEEFLPLMWEVNSTDGLVDAFLYFCGLPPLTSPSNIGTTSRWVGDNFLRNEFMGDSDSALGEWLSGSADGSAVSFPYHNFIHTADTFFTKRPIWFSSFERWAESSSGNSDIDADWVRRSLRLLVEASPENDDLAEYALALEFVSNSKEAKKYAKALLKKRQSRLRLYNSYALMEYRSGNHAAGDHVWATSISMSKDFAEHDRADTALLWRTWIWESLEARDLARASSLLLAMPQHTVDLTSLSAPGQPTFSPTEMLKMNHFLSGSRESALAAHKANVFVANTDCLAILLYLSNSLDLTKGVEIYVTALAKLYASPMQTETFKYFTAQLLHQARARLLYYHIRTSSIYKPSQIRALLVESISMFPHNTIFLSLFAWNESRFRIEERVRDVVRDVTTSQHRTDSLQSITTTQAVPITSHLFSIYTELNRPVYAGSTLHSTRAAFEKAIGDPNPRTNATTTDTSTARSNLTIWKLYILLELSHNEIQRAKDVFYRGMRACPWSKELIMLAFTHLRADLHKDDATKKGAGMGFEELRRVYNVLVEKELRVHVDIEEMLEEIMAKNMRTTTNSLGIPIQMPDDEDSQEEL